MMENTPACSVKISYEQQQDSSVDRLVPGYVDNAYANMPLYPETGDQQWSAWNSHHGNGVDNGYLPSEIAAEHSPSPSKTCPGDTHPVGGDFAGHTTEDFGSRGKPSSSNVTNRNAEEYAFGDLNSGFGGKDAWSPEHPPTFSGTETGSGSGGGCQGGVFDGGEGTGVPRRNNAEGDWSHKGAWKQQWRFDAGDTHPGKGDTHPEFECWNCGPRGT